MTKLKTLYVMEILQKYTDTEHSISAEDICSVLKSEHNINAERKSIYRDIKILTEYGMDIRRASNGFYVGSREFLPSEVLLLMAAVQSAEFITSVKCAQLLDKLSTLLSTYQSEHLRKLIEHRGTFGNNEEIYKSIDIISAAIAQKQKLSFYYYDYKNGERNDERILFSAYAIIWKSDNCCVVGNAEGEDRVSYYRIDGMHGAHLEKLPRRHFSEVVKE